MANIRSTTDVVEVETRVKATPETLWAFLTEPEMMTRWKGQKAELDPRPGGVYRVEISDQVKAVGEFVELEPYSRVLITFGWEGHVVSPGSTRVEITLEPDGDETIVRLRHMDLPADETEIHADGWQHYLARLSKAGAGEDPGPDPNENPQPQS